jgi:hypothetical protein
MNKLTRTLHPEIRVIDETKGLVDYIASDEAIDSYHEVIRAKGWRFNRFAKNAPFVDSHDYWSLDKQLGKVVEWKLVKGQLVERVQWAIDVAENTLAQLGWKMTVAGYLKAVSVGFIPTGWVHSFDETGVYEQQLKELGKSRDDRIRTIYLEQEQIELSACLIGANPNAVAKSFKAGVLSEEDLDRLTTKLEQFAAHGHAASTPGTAAPSTPPGADRESFLRQLKALTNR